MQVQITYKNNTTMTTELNGNCYILDTKPTFPSDLSLITVQGEDVDWVFHNASVQECGSTDGRYWWCFIEKSSLDLLLEQMTANNDYCLMLLGEE